MRRFGERRALMLGLGCGAIGFLIFALAPTGPLSWLGIPVMALWGVSGAAIQSLMTQLVAPDQQGQLQGATTSVQSVSQMVGPFLFTLTFAYFIGAQAPLQLPGAPFLLASALLLLALVIAARTLTDRPGSDRADRAGSLPPGARNHLCSRPRLQEADMVADSNSQIAWHRAQIRKHRDALKQIETARHNFGEIAGSRSIDQTQKTVAELKRKIREFRTGHRRL